MVMIIFTAILAAILIFSRRKLGFFGLAIFMGIQLDKLWNLELTNLLLNLKLNIPSSALSGMVGLILILAPAFLLLPKCKKQEKWAWGLLAGLIVVIFVGSVSGSRLGGIFSFDVLSITLREILESYYRYIVSAMAGLIIIDRLFFSVKKIDKKA